MTTLKQILARSLSRDEVAKARLDADRLAKPLTEIRAVHRAGDCVQPGIGASAYEVSRDEVDSGALLRLKHAGGSRVRQIRVVITGKDANVGHQLFSCTYGIDSQQERFATCGAIGELLRDFPEGEMKITRG